MVRILSSPSSKGDNKFRTSSEHIYEEIPADKRTKKNRRRTKTAGSSAERPLPPIPPAEVKKCKHILK